MVKTANKSRSTTKQRKEIKTDKFRQNFASPPLDASQSSTIMSTPQFSPNIDPALYADEQSFTQNQPQPAYQPQSQSYFPTFPPIQKPSPPPELPPPPSEAVDGAVASQTLQKLISLELRDVGFGSAQPSALQRLEHEVVTCQSHLRLQFDELNSHYSSCRTAVSTCP